MKTKGLNIVNNIINNMEKEEIRFDNPIRRTGGPKDNLQLGITVPAWVTQNFDFEKGDKVEVIIKKKGEENGN